MPSTLPPTPISHLILSHPKRMNFNRAMLASCLFHLIMLLGALWFFYDSTKPEMVTYIEIQMGEELSIKHANAAAAVPENLSWHQSPPAAKEAAPKNNSSKLPTIHNNLSALSPAAAVPLASPKAKASPLPQIKPDSPAMAEPATESPSEPSAAQSEEATLTYQDLMQQFAGSLAGSSIGNRNQAEVTTIRQYAEMLSLWIERHQPKTAVKKAGRGIIGVLVNQHGYILRAELVQSTGSANLDSRIMNMVRQSNPVPPLPVEWRSAQEYFKIPFSFNYQ